MGQSGGQKEYFYPPKGLDEFSYYKKQKPPLYLESGGSMFNFKCS